MSTLACWNCGAALTSVVLPMGRRADCPECRAELHCCRMCRDYDPRRPDACREDRAEPPTRKDVANFCDWFAPMAGLGGEARQEAQTRSALNSLFGGDGAAAAEGDENESGAAPESDARRRLDDLFD